MPDRRNVNPDIPAFRILDENSSFIYLYDGSFEGLLTCAARSLKFKSPPWDILPGNTWQPDFFHSPVQVAPSAETAGRFSAWLQRRMGMDALVKTYYAFLSGRPGVERMLCEYLETGISAGRRIDDMLSREEVHRIEMLAMNVTREYHKHLGFIRFAMLKNRDLLYARIKPANHILPLLAPHFIDRLPGQPWIIYDEGRMLSILSDGYRWFLNDQIPDGIPILKDDEKTWQELWKAFYRNIGIAERENQKLMQSLMPKRYWKNMIELQM